MNIDIACIYCRHTSYKYSLIYLRGGLLYSVKPIIKGNNLPQLTKVLAAAVMGIVKARLKDGLELYRMDEQNASLINYVENDYNIKVHSVMNSKPIDKFISSIDRVGFISSA